MNVPISPDLALAFLVFAVVSAITPGPNNMMLMASGLNFGFRPSMPHLLGVHLGFTFMLVLVGFGLGQVFAAYPAIYTGMKGAGTLYMLWLAWKIARSGPLKEGAAAGKPLTFFAAAAFQWINPKAWAMVVGAVAAYTEPTAFARSMLAITLIYLVAGAPCSVVWVAFGTTMRGLLTDARQVRVFNLAMAGLLVASLVPVAADLAGAAFGH